MGLYGVLSGERKRLVPRTWCRFTEYIKKFRAFLLIAEDESLTVVRLAWVLEKNLLRDD